MQIETVASKESLEKHPQPRAPGPEKLFDSGPDSGPEKLFHSGPGFGPRKVVYHSSPEKMAGGHKCVASKEPLEKHPQPRAPGHEKLFDSGPDSGPEKLFLSGPGFGPRKVV